MQSLAINLKIFINFIKMAITYLIKKLIPDLSRLFRAWIHSKISDPNLKTTVFIILEIYGENQLSFGHLEKYSNWIWITCFGIVLIYFSCFCRLIYWLYLKWFYFEYWHQNNWFLIYCITVASFSKLLREHAKFENQVAHFHKLDQNGNHIWNTNFTNSLKKYQILNKNICFYNFRSLTF